MATVHLARQVGAAGFSRIVAVKRAHERFARDPEFAAMFLDEGRLVARIRHPNVVQTIDVVAEESELFLVMEYVHGESLLRLWQQMRRREAFLPISICAAIMVGALHGLHEAHEARSETGEPLGIVHRDVSPHNILVGVDGVARVLDFGVAKASERITTTQEGQLKGKLSYMAPEQVHGRAIDRRTDVYAAAVVLWETLAGTKLFQGPNEAQVLQEVIIGEVRPPSAHNRSVGPELDAVVMRGLARDPGARFRTAREMAIALERATTPASASEVGAFVSTECAESLRLRARLIADIEHKTSSASLKEAVDSLRSLQRAGGSSSSGPFGTVSSVPPARFHAPPAPMATFPPEGGGLKEPSNAMNVATAPRKSSGRAVLALAAAVGVVTLATVLGGFAIHRSRSRASAPATLGSMTSATAGAGGSTTTAASIAGAAVVATCPGGMVSIPGGRFFMGSDDDLPAEKPAHKVELRAYCIDKHEVTTEAYKACSDRGDCKRAGLTNRWEGITAKDTKTYDPLCNVQDASRGKHPINCVDWSMAERFCKAEGKRLPTEAEWEFAARGSDGRKYPWGDDKPSAKHLNACGSECTAWGKKHGAILEGMYGDDDGWATTAPVGSFPLGASRWGVEDVVGNVWEWVADFYGAYDDVDQSDPTGPTTGTTRVIRGGAWNGAYPDWVRPTFRFHNAPDTRSHGVGFRCAKTI
jgi:serine/threonine-protein kinase